MRLTCRDLLGALFKKLNVLVAEDGLQLAGERTEINKAFHEWQTHRRITTTTHTTTKRRLLANLRGAVLTPKIVSLSPKD